MKIKRPVQVKVILTEAAKKEMQQEFKEKISQLKLELEQLRFQSKKILHEASKKSAEHIRQLQDKLQQEEKKRQEEVELVLFQQEQLQLLPIGTEVLHSTVESEIEIHEGDDWQALMKQAEIVLKDGMIYEIREGRILHE